MIRKLVYTIYLLAIFGRVYGASTGLSKNASDECPQTVEFTAAILKKLTLTNATKLDISSGEVTVTQSYHMIEGEGAAADDLDTITSCEAGVVYVLRPYNTSHDITIKDGTGNIEVSTGNDYTIPGDGFAIMVSDGTYCYVTPGAEATVADLADGSVSDAEFQYLDGVTSDIQTQIDAKGDTVTEGSLPDSVIVSADIKDDEIVDADINASAAIDATKIADGSVTDTEFQYIGTASSDVQAQLDNKLSDGFADFDDATEATISSGTLTVTQSCHTVDTEGDAASDDIVTISASSAETKILFLWLENDSREATLVHGTGNIETDDGTDFDITAGCLVLLMSDGSSWRMVAGGGGTTSGTYVEISNATQWFTRSFTINDEPDDNAQHFRIQIDDDADFSSVIIDHNSRDSGDGGDGQSGCEYFNGTSWVAWTSGSGVINSYEGNRGCYSWQSASTERSDELYIRMKWFDGTEWDPDWNGDKLSY